MQPLWFIFYKDKLLLTKQGENFSVPTGGEAPVELSKSSSVMEVGTMDDGTPIKTFALYAPFIKGSTLEWIEFPSTSIRTLSQSREVSRTNLLG